MNFELKPLCDEHMEQFKKDMQAAFQKGAVDGLGETTEDILPEEDINRSLSSEGAAAYEALVDGALAGGAIVVTDAENGHGHLDFLYVKDGVHNKGIGQAIWNALEKLYPDTRVWETCTPYFDKRNIHFYVNKCGFHIVEFYNKYHCDPNDLEKDDGNEYFSGMFRFEKVMNSTVR